MTRPNRHTLAIDDGPDVVWVDAVHHERDYGCFVTSRSNQPQSIHRLKTCGRVRHQGLLVRGNRVEPNLAEIVDRGVQGDRAGDVWRAGLELERQVGPRASLERYRADHVAAAEERRHRLEDLFPSVQHANA